MKNVKYLVLGAGPAGLSFANRLKQRGETSFLVLEKETQAGGLCRSEDVDGKPLDIGGGHFLDVRRPKVCEFLFGFMPEDEWNRFDRDSRILINGMEVSHPLEANIWQFPEALQREYLESIKQAGCNSGKPMPEKFVDWIFWKLGDRIAEDYMIPYNQKMFADKLNELGTYWLEKLPNVDYEDTLRSCEEHRAYGTQPGHQYFYYPKEFGYGEVWLRMADKIKDNLCLGISACELDLDTKVVTTSDGELIQAEKIITTIPWTSLNNISGFSDKTHSRIGDLVSSSIEIRYVSEDIASDAQWIYDPNPGKPYHRILNRRVFCPESKGYWVETRGERVALFDEADDSYRYLNDYAYPLNTIDKPDIIEALLEEAKAKGVFGLGRWGEHSHYNSDLVVEKALALADEI